MKRNWPWLLLLLPLILWCAAPLPDLLNQGPDFWTWRRALIVATGIFALWWMSAGMLLAAHPGWLERRLDGLDRLYRWHKNVGIGAGLLVLVHWLCEWAPKQMGKLGWLPPRVRGPKPPESLWLELAKEIGEWSGYLLMALVVVALLKRIPYRYFRWLHKALALLFVGGAYHGLMLLPDSFWRQPLGWLSALLAATGVAIAVVALAGGIGRSRRHRVRIEALATHGDILEIACTPLAGWPGHRAGQFVLADFGHPGEGAHPFTLASASGSAQLMLAVKTLGDYTRTLSQRLRVGDEATLEGPYGSFDFAGAGPQIWVAGGIGVTPFLARLDALASWPQETRPATDFFYCTPGSTAFPGDLEQRCAAAGVRLHRRNTDANGLLTAEEIAAALQPGTSLWFCGPARWGKALEKTLSRLAPASFSFHREQFEFR